MMKKLQHILTIATLCMSSTYATAQVDDETRDNNNGIMAGYFDSKDGINVNYSSFKLPPLDILFTNARSNPSIEMLEKERLIAKELLRKEKFEFLSHITGHGSYSYGIMDNYGSNSSVTSPIYYQYMGSKQHYWNVGANVSFSVEDILDIRKKVKRKRYEYQKSELEKEEAYNNLKQEIVTLYVKINNDLISLKTAAENAASYKGAGLMTDQEFKLGDVTVRDLAETKRWESTAVQEYQMLQTQITTNILILEIITHTPIITNITNEITSEK